MKFVRYNVSRSLVLAFVRVVNSRTRAETPVPLSLMNETVGWREKKKISGLPTSTAVPDPDVRAGMKKEEP